MVKIRYRLLGLAAQCLFLGGASAGPPADMLARCRALNEADFSAIPDAATEVIEALPNQSDGTSTYCEVTGYVAPSFGFLLRAPLDQWNGKFIEIGCGGPCGPAMSKALLSRCNDPLRRGYACAISDGGHQSSVSDAKWAYNVPGAAVDYFVRAPHVTALAGKAIVTHLYNRAADRSYFAGCSAGGIQGLWIAQKFPWDFDGIIAGAPALNLTGVWMNLLWNNRALTDSGTGESLLGQSELELLHQAVLAKCDQDDGLKDGLIADPRACRFDPSELRCNSSRRAQCLTGPQIDAVKKIYRGPVTSGGTQLVEPAALKGSELNWLFWFGATSKVNPKPFIYIGDWFRYSFFQPNPGPAWKPADFDFDRDYKRLGMGELLEPANPDLRRFGKSGAKLLLYTGWTDEIEGVVNTIDYYETAERIMGGRASTQQFLRLFVIPGMNHCGLVGGDLTFTTADYLSSLESWVEKNQAPERLISLRIRSSDATESLAPVFPFDPARIELSRPVFPYPTKTRYLGHGNPSDARNFGPAGP